MKNLIISFLLLFSLSLTAQKLQSNVEFSGNKVLVLLAKKEAMKSTGKLATGEMVRVGCDQGACYFEIVYKDRSVRQTVGDDITKLNIYEYDFGADGDIEIVAVNEYKGTAFLLVLSYSKGIIQELFKKEIKSNRVLISKDYLEYYLPAGLDSVWNFYKGRFWAMTPYKN
jgi:hypothetical protein